MNNILICTEDENLKPEKKTEFAACLDIKTSKDFSIKPGKVVQISAWVKTVLPKGWQCKVYARSSLPGKFGLMLANSVAIFDADYRGEYILQLYNFTDKKVNIDKYTRLAQMDFQPYLLESWKYTKNSVPKINYIIDKNAYNDWEKLHSSKRGKGGLWSTWVK